jgi:ribonuclease BN (tRNA processing enzyme)
MNTSILVQLGNGENFVFDIGEGSVANYPAAGIALNQIDKVFITHLHVDHFGSLPYLWMFRTWAGGWHERLNVYGPSGRTPEYGTAKMVEGMKMMLGWHTDAFSVFPVGKGWDIQVGRAGTFKFMSSIFVTTAASSTTKTVSRSFTGSVRMRRTAPPATGSTGMA